jgi:nitrate/TMAO reductase-like tetraheme cytochrome c subunit
MEKEHTNNSKNTKVKLLSKLSNKKIIFIMLITFVFLGIGGMVGAKGVLKASDKPSFCTSCHNMQPMYDSYQHSNLLANSHAKAKDKVVCHDCHESSLVKKASEGVKYVTGDYETPMKTRGFSDDMCLKCHKMNEVKSKTNFDGSNPHQSHLGKLECSSCHKMHEPSKVYCSNCHESSLLWMENLPEYFKKP